MLPVSVDTLAQFNEYFHQPSPHPLVGVGNLAQADPSLFALTQFNLYCLVLMDSDFGLLVKNGHPVHYGSCNLFSVRPGETLLTHLNGTRPRGWMLAFHPDLLEKSGLGRDFYMFSYFDFEIETAVNLSPEERGDIYNSFCGIRSELAMPIDHLKNHMLRLNIGLLLSWAKRFYERQYAQLTEQRPQQLGARLDALLANYLGNGLAGEHGQPTVAWCARQFNLSPNYFGDLMRRELGISARDYIQKKIIDAACHMLLHTPANITEIAQELGFNYPNHFTRQFRNKTGLSPSAYRRKALNQ